MAGSNRAGGVMTTYLYGIIIGLHTLGAIVWVGGMFFSVVVLRPAVAGFEAAERLALWRAVLPVFFRWVGIAALVLLATGLGALDLYHGGLWGGGPHVDLMMLFGLAMVVLFLYVLALPWRGFKAALAAGDLAAAAAHMERIRTIVGTNLGLGLATAFIGAAGTFLGH